MSKEKHNARRNKGHKKSQTLPGLILQLGSLANDVFAETPNALPACCPVVNKINPIALPVFPDHCKVYIQLCPIVSFLHKIDSRSFR